MERNQIEIQQDSGSTVNVLALHELCIRANLAVFCFLTEC